MLLRRILFGGVALVLLTYLLFRPPPPGGDDQQLVQEQFARHGHLVHGYRSGWTRRRSVRRHRKPVRDVERALHAYTQRWQPEGDGALGTLNAQLAEGAVIDVPEDMQPLFAQARAVGCARSGGAFDARVGALVELWGFHLEEAFRRHATARGSVCAASGSAWRKHPPTTVRAMGRRLV